MTPQFQTPIYTKNLISDTKKALPSFYHWVAIVSAVLLLQLLSPLDESWLKSGIMPHRFLSPEVLTFFNQSVFEGGWIGFTDIPTFLAIISLVYGIYFKAKHQPIPIWLKILLFYCLTVATLGVHVPKKIIGRARPYLVSENKNLFSAWSDWGHLKPWGEISGSGSFPSGHTANAFLLVGFIIIMWRYSQINYSKKIWILGMSISVSGVILTGWSRIQSLAHWPTDVIAAGALNAIYLYVICSSMKPTSNLSVGEPIPPFKSLYFRMVCLFLGFLFLSKFI
jgi:membrane-associated phospholipid phosphatase